MRQTAFSNLNSMETILKIVLAILLFTCLAQMPYGYYQFVRVAALVVFALLAYAAYEKGQMQLFIMYVGLAALFQPLVKIALGRGIWNIVDVVVGIGLLVSVFYQPKPKTE